MSKFSNFVDFGLFQNASQILLSQDSYEQQLVLMEDLFDRSNLAGYAFGAFLALTQKKVLYYHLVKDILAGDLCFLKGAYASAFGYALVAYGIEFSEIDFLRTKLFFFSIPEKIVCGVEARISAKKLLLIEPNDSLAQLIVSETLKYEGRKSRRLGLKTPVTKKFKLFVRSGRFDQALFFCDKISEDKIFDILLNISSKKRITGYSFIWFLIYQRESASLHIAAKKMVEVGFKNLTGAPGIIFFHLHKAVELEPENVEIIEQLLEIYELTPESFEPEETKVFAEKVLAQKPESPAALRVLGALS